MARPQSRVDLMHVPTPDVVIDAIAKAIEIPENAYCLDPCCGDGSALARLAPGRKLYGVELDRTRAGEAAKRFDQVLPCAFQDTRITPNSFGLILLNPPYDDSVKGRLEAEFLRLAERALAPEGVLVLICNIDQVANLSGPLDQDFRGLRHWRFPEGYFDGPHMAYRQTVFVLTKRKDAVRPRGNPSFFRTQWAPSTDLPETPHCVAVAPTGRWPHTFVSLSYMTERLGPLLAASPVSRAPRTPNRLGCGAPPLPLKDGHLAMVLASGAVNGLCGDDEDNTLHVAKGTVQRMTTTKTEVDETPGGRLAVNVHETDSFQVSIRALRPCGRLVSLQGAGQEKDDADE